MNNPNLSWRRPSVFSYKLTHNLEVGRPWGCGEPGRPRGDLAPEHAAGGRGRVVEDDVGRRGVSQDLHKTGDFYQSLNIFKNCVSPLGLAWRRQLYSGLLSECTCRDNSDLSCDHPILWLSYRTPRCPCTTWDCTYSPHPACSYSGGQPWIAHNFTNSFQTLAF